MIPKMGNEVMITEIQLCLTSYCVSSVPRLLREPLDENMAFCVLVANPGNGPSPWPYYCSGHSDLSSCSLFRGLDFHFRLREGLREPNVPEMPRKWEPWMNSWAYWSTGSLCILTFIISVGCWCSWLMGPGAVHPSLHINYWRGVFPVIYLTVGCDKYP